MSELVGSSVTLSNFDSPTHLAAERQINTLFDSNLDRKKTFDLLKTILVYYGVPRMSFEFYDYFLGEDAFMKLDRFQQAIRKYQMKAIRLFSTFREAYTKLNKEGDLKQFFRPLEPLKKIEIDLQYKQRTSWDAIEIIDESKLRYLGYIAAREVRQERNNRQALVDFLIELAAKLKNAESNVDAASVVDHYSEKKKRKMSSLLTKYRSNLKHSLLSPLFPLDPDLIQREADFLSTGIEDSDLNVMEETQSIAVKNLAQYLTADHMDVYVATSMRTESDFVSVNRFVERLFNNELMVPLNLRYFNPTQSWIEDRVAKGLVEALILKRANYCIYMAQKEDTFGKDSEASVALGQGKTVIVYVPKLSIPKAGIDMEDISKKGRDELINEIKKIGEDDDLDIDKTEDEAAIQSRFLTILLKKMDQKLLAGAAIDHWADFD